MCNRLFAVGRLSVVRISLCAALLGVCYDADAQDMGGPFPSEFLTNGDLESIRSLYLQSAVDERLIDSAFVLVNALPEQARDTPLIEAYDGALTVMKAKHAFWPRKRLGFVKEGLRVLDATVTSDPTNAEIRYLRLISCYYLPRLFGRGWSVAEDLTVLSENVRELKGIVDSEFYEMLVRFVLENAEIGADVRADLLVELRDESTVDSPSERLR